MKRPHKGLFQFRSKFNFMFTDTFCLHRSLMPLRNAAGNGESYAEASCSFTSGRIRPIKPVEQTVQPFRIQLFTCIHSPDNNALSRLLQRNAESVAEKMKRLLPCVTILLEFLTFGAAFSTMLHGKISHAPW